MRRSDLLLAELAHETATTRKHLERLPDGRFDWRPHAKSFSAGELASHIVECIRWTAPIFAADELDWDTGAFSPLRAASSADLLAAFDSEVANAKRAIEDAADKDASELWRLKMRGIVWFEKPRESVFRDMTLSHLVHHRGQLSVYLRLLGVAVPGSYGPTADESS